MIRQRATVNNQPIEDLIGYLDGYADIVNEEFGAAFDTVQPSFLGELRTIPDKPSYPIQWQSDKQRRAFFATDGFGGGIPHVRTGAYQQGWSVTYTVGGLQITVIVQNASPGAKYVGGSLSKSNPGGFMQRMHIASGYVPAYKTTNFWLEALWETFYNNMFNRLGSLVGSTTVNTRAYTTGRRT